MTIYDTEDRAAGKSGATDMWSDSYMKITYGMIALAISPVVVVALRAIFS